MTIPFVVTTQDQLEILQSLSNDELIELVKQVIGPKEEIRSAKFLPFSFGEFRKLSCKKRSKDNIQ